MPRRSKLVLLVAGVVFAIGVLVMVSPRPGRVAPPPDPEVLAAPASPLFDGLPIIKLGMPRDVVEKLLGGPANSSVSPEWKVGDTPSARLWIEAEVWQEGDYFVGVAFDQDGRVSAVGSKERRRDPFRGEIRLR